MDEARIERFTSRVEAELACSMLSAHGFRARVSGDDVAGIHPDIPFGIGGTAVVVPGDQYEDAVALLDQEFAGPLGDVPDPEPLEHAAASPETAGLPATPDAHAAAPSLTERDRRPGMRVFAVVAAVLMLVVFVAVAGASSGWW